MRIPLRLVYWLVSVCVYRYINFFLLIWCLFWQPEVAVYGLLWELSSERVEGLPGAVPGCEFQMVGAE